MKNPQDLPSGRVPRWTLGDRLRKARVWRGIERTDMAASIGCSDRTVSNYELDQTRPPKLVINHYALMTGVPIEWLMNESFHPEGTTATTTDCYPAFLDLVEAA